jgi:kumamolisin
VPDVALNADTNTGYAIYYDGHWQIYGGTSCAAPLWAAFTACVNQALITAQQPALGFANPKLYAIGNGGSYTTDFHDVTTGNNLYYAAKVGYDNASGWGSFNGTNLYTSLTNSTTSPLLNIILKHNAPFTSGENGTYRLVISNTGSGSISGPVTAAITLPQGLSYSSYSGSGWIIDESTLTFTQNGILNQGSSYPTLVINVQVANNAPRAVIPTATVSVEGSAPKTVSNLTTIR